MTFVAAYCVRLVSGSTYNGVVIYQSYDDLFHPLFQATKTTDVNWSKSEEPWNSYRGKQFKFLNPKGIDYEEQGKKIPNIKDI